MNSVSLSPLLTTNQEELINKFNAAFYDAQTINNSNDFTLSYYNDTDITNDSFLLETLDESFFTNASNFLPLTATGPSSEEDGFYVDFTQLGEKTDEGFSEAFSDGIASELVTPSSDCTSTFDYDDFSQNFEQFNHAMANFPCQEDLLTSCKYSDASIVLPPVNTIRQCNWEFGQFLRHQDNSSLNFHDLSIENNDFGHFATPAEEDTTFLQINDDSKEENDQENLLVLNQNDALIFDEPTFFSNKETFTFDDELLEERDTGVDGDTKKFERERKYSTDSDFDEFIVQSLQCKWLNCYQVYDTQSALVRHIEKSHVEIKRGDEFTCFWYDCPRKTKPFNARYKLLIHMRVHSGEKPNKCPFNGCNKAFSRLENLKIHQRSHTGERPYLCQFPTCTKSFSNSSDRAKHQRTHFDTKPYACQIKNCMKKYTDPSSLRKHVKNHTPEEQMQLKIKSFAPDFHANSPPKTPIVSCDVKQEENSLPQCTSIKEECFYANYEHDYTIARLRTTFDVKQDLKIKLSEKMHRNNGFK